MNNEFNNNLEVFEDKGLYGYKDTDRNIVIEASYTEANNFSDGIALVKSRDVICTGTDRFDGYGYINVKGELVIPFEYYYSRQILRMEAHVFMIRQIMFLEHGILINQVIRCLAIKHL